MSVSADKFIAIAASQLGYHVQPGKQNKYGKWYGIPTGAWCAMFLSWVSDQAGARDIFPHFAWTPAGAQWFKDRGQWTNGLGGVRRGDVVFYDFPDNVKRIQHVGIVEYVHSDGSVTTIEGNTSNAASQSNGGWLMRKRRKSYIVGYGRPAWGNSSGSSQASRDYLQKGDTGNEVRAMQAALVQIGFGVGPSGADGSFGPATEKAVKAFQASRGIAQDGSYGPITRGKLREAIGLNADGTPRTKARPNVTELQRAIRTAVDNSWGPNTDKHFDALREASQWGGHDFPYGVAFAQQVVGTTPDGSWGPKSVKAHDRTVAAVQSALWRLGYDPGTIDGSWGPKTEAAYQRARSDCRV